MNTLYNKSKKVLIANRGEIAVRIIRACRDYGIQTIAVYADVDVNALPVQLADEAYRLGGNTPAETYLHIPRLLEIAQQSGATMVHPGYGFLSERAEFARAVIDAGLIWIGPHPETIDELGDKIKARRIAQKVGAPLVIGTAEPVKDVQEVVAFAETHGLPIAIKAAFGGGGRGLKVAWRLDEVAELYHSAVREATAAFGRGECFIEQFLNNPRHIEAQVIADKQGNVVVLGTRDCSLQRRNQKLVEEAPAPFLTQEQRERIHQSAKAICVEANYVGAGTVEFLLSADGALSFLEVNTRLQVEHPVTEETTGIDLVIEQLRVAEGYPLSIQETPVPKGHSFEFRINAEDAGKGFLPTSGIISEFIAPSGPGIRLDSGVLSGSIIPATFDSLMAKLIVTGANREQAISRARRALREFEISGVASVLPFHQAVMEHPDFVSSDNFHVHTRWIETDFVNALERSPRQAVKEDKGITRTFIEIDGCRHELGLPSDLLSGLTQLVPVSERPFFKPLAKEKVAEDPHQVKAPISGVLHSWLVTEGEEVRDGDVIAVMEAMKMEVQISAHRSGKITFCVRAGDYHDAESILATID
ncbi:ATP-grasp domain-containing protein [Xenorhabdus nematophila]|uniref:Biotin carboxylase n=1 Tax=Xenorhabdus nematophila (strain ATCC 19061 / DSM 3370 / CCUG 14189 / LMG 1036 / NCIMB 9965 / AN6) TaxID=406817 RepID=D3VJE8_XENNA|nr:biotin carboxylase N-terminal domain-containing protein [Xenorhabdus nematophila]CEE91222.1 bifunctional protein (Includes: biotin carboxylase; biotin carboxyl carrier protein) [Xenorhabdus nematophila str. Anatoliense]CEF29763.1 bifunctional protein (Includes: biotin carboxylase; biotin carboxyl carrier protein) [Xenorhabdus nematophila str. Websteri]AYA41224.1 ATP-grasp domain-containing protein [Xenorhabdus nematophila]MBA0019965.1 ATP-grasp domain-containing protein [Xenorhabdus nematoph